MFLVDFSEVDVSPNDTVFLDKLNFIIRFYGFLCVKTAPSNIWGKFFKIIISRKTANFPYENNRFQDDGNGRLF